jgi:hypothetical protein
MRKLRFIIKAVLRIWKQEGEWNSADMVWTDQDALSLGHYLGNTSGKHLAARLRFASLEHNRTAVEDGGKHRCGVAVGYMRAIQDIQFLSQGAIAAEEQPEATNNVVSISGLDHLAS